MQKISAYLFLCLFCEFFKLWLVELKGLCYNDLYYSPRRTNKELSMKYITASQAAEKWHISQRRVQVLCSEGRIEGVFKLGENWAIPEDSQKPTDGRTKKEQNDEQV